jgi:hypothetical protein
MLQYLAHVAPGRLPERALAAMPTPITIGGSRRLLIGAYGRVPFDPPLSYKKIPHPDPNFGTQPIFAKLNPKQGLWIYKKGENKPSVEMTWKKSKFG